MAHLWLLFFINFYFKPEAQGFGINLIKIPDDDPAQTVCTIALLAKYFQSGEALSGSVIQMSITSAPTYVQKSLLHALHAAPNNPWTIVVKNSQDDVENGISAKHVLQEKPQCYFLVIENVKDEDMDEIFDSWKSNLNWNPLAQFVVYFSAVEETEEEMTDIMMEILLSFMNKKIYNVNIIGQSEESSFYFGKTVFPYHPDNNCGNRVISMETLDVCDYQENQQEDNHRDEDYEGEGEVEYGQETINKVMEQGSWGNQNAAEDENVYNSLIAYQRNKQKIMEEDSEEANDPNITSTIPPIESSSMIQNFQDLTLDIYTDNSTTSDYPKYYMEELYRGLFLDKFPRDLSGCPLVAGFRPWEPYIFKEALDSSTYTDSTETEAFNQTTYNYADGEEDNVDEDYYMVYNKQQEAEEHATGRRLYGIEYKMIQTIAERLHISIEMQVENKNLYHLFQQLIDGDIEMIVGGIDEDPSLSQFVSSTIAYHQDDLTWCVAKAQHVRNLFNFLGTFQIGSWLLILFFMLAVSLSILLSQQCLQFPLGFLKSCLRINVYVIGIILGQTIRLRPMPISLKLCFGTTFFMGLMFSNIYHSFLISTLTTPKSSHQISHLNEIYQNRMHIRGSGGDVRHLNREGEIYRYVREQFAMCNDIEECLQHAAINTKLAVIASRQHYLYNPRIPRNSLYCFSRNENIYVYLVTILMPKKFHLLHKINPVIQHIIESGHMQMWARELDRSHTMNDEMQHDRESKFKSLKLSQVAGSFIFNCILLAFAFCIFGLECLVYWLVVKRRTKFKLAKYVHNKFI